MQPIGYRYPPNYINIQIASPTMDIKGCKRHDLYECNGSFFIKGKGCKFIPGRGPVSPPLSIKRRPRSPSGRRPYKKFVISPSLSHKKRTPFKVQVISPTFKRSTLKVVRGKSPSPLVKNPSPIVKGKVKI